MSFAYLGLGSNLGDRGKYLQQALVSLEQRVGMVWRTSSLYESEPVGFLDQPWFLNMVAMVETDCSPEDLLMAVRMIENVLGRERTMRFGPRTIDVDILLYGKTEVLRPSVVRDVPGLQIPHPRMHERKFVLLPMVEIAPDVLHPVFHLTMKELLEKCRDESMVRLSASDSSSPSKNE